MKHTIAIIAALILASALYAQPPDRRGAGGPPPQDRRGMGDQAGRPGGPPPQGDWIKLLDSNMNQTLEQDEFQQAVERTFADLDKNGNGTLEAEELHVRPGGGGGDRPPMQGERPRPGQGFEGRPENSQRPPQVPRPGEDKRLLPPFFFMRGVEQVASLTKAQFERSAREVFSEMDKNGDGVLTKSEGRPPRRDGDGPGEMSEPSGPPPPPNAKFVGAELRFGDRLVKSQPFSADIVIEDTRRLFDGTTVSKKSNGAIYRDSAGRTRREQALDLVGGHNIVGPDNKKQTMVFINDFSARTQYFLDPNRKIAERHDLGGGAAPEPPKPNNAQVESLGTKMIEGVTVEGTRISFQIPAGELADKPMSVVTENWFAPELQMLVYSRHVDPIAGEHVFKLINIKRAEPAADLFTVPAGYKMQGRPMRED